MTPSNNQPDPSPVEQQEANPQQDEEQTLPTHYARSGQANLQRFRAVHGNAETSIDPGTQGSEMTVRQSIEKFVGELKQLLSDNIEPELNNTLHQDVLIASENVRKPWLNLRLLTGLNPLDAIVTELSNMEIPSEGHQWQAVIDDKKEHRTAASIRHAPDNAKKVSIIFVEPLPVLGYHFTDSPESLKTLKDLGFSVSASHVSTGVQGGGGCTFFALSAAKIMAKSTEIDNLHKELLASAPNPGGSEVIHKEIIHPFSLEPAFFKHATSMNLIDAYLKDKPESLISKPVNKKGDTLDARVKAHMTTRVKEDANGAFKEVTYSNSIEKKRIYMYETALETLGAKLDKPDWNGDDDLQTKLSQEQILIKDLQITLLGFIEHTQEEILQKLQIFESMGLDVRQIGNKINGQSILHLACKAFQMSACSEEQENVVISSLIQFGVDVNARDLQQRTPLFDAIFSESLTRELIRHGADVNAVMHHENDEGLTLLRYGLRELNLGSGIFQELIKAGAKIDEEARNDVVNKVHADRMEAVPGVEADAESWIRFFAVESIVSGMV